MGVYIEHDVSFLRVYYRVLDYPAPSPIIPLLRIIRSRHTREDASHLPRPSEAGTGVLTCSSLEILGWHDHREHENPEAENCKENQGDLDSCVGNL